MSMGSQGRLAIDTVLPFDGSSLPLEFDTENLAKTGTIIDTAGIRGTRSHQQERTRTGNYSVAGTIEMFPAPAELNNVLEWIMGGAPTVGTPVGSTTFPLAETIPTREVLIDRVARRFEYAACKVNRATFSSREGEALKLALDLVGTTELVTATAFPTLTYALEAPFVFMDAVLTLQSATRNMKDVTIIIDNVLDVAFNNSTTASTIVASDRIISLSCLNPFVAADIALYDQALAGATASVIFTNGNFKLTFTFGGRLQFPAESPAVAGKGEIPLRLNGIARKNGTTDELSIVLDLTG